VSIELVDYMPFAKMMGIEVLEHSKDRVVGRLEVRTEVCTTGHILHGGAVMAFADTLGAIGAFETLPEGAKATTTVESKTNFLGAAKEGSVVWGESVPIKVGRTLGVWQTTMRLDDQNGKLVAMVTQSQLVLY